MGVLYGQVDLARDLPYLNAAWQLMIGQMAAGLQPADAEAKLSGELAAGADLKTALEKAGFTTDDIDDNGDNNNVDNGNVDDNNGDNENIDNGNVDDNGNNDNNNDGDNG